jgi:hypothetical protein
VRHTLLGLHYKTSHTKTVQAGTSKIFVSRKFFFTKNTLNGWIETVFNGDAILKYPATGWSAERTENSQFLDYK